MIIKTFREVIADIKEGEVWETSADWDIKEVKLQKGHLLITRRLEVDEPLVIKNTIEFKLKKKQVPFTEAFLAYETGKEIESCYNKRKYVKAKEKPYEINNSLIGIDEIRSLWYINN